MVRPLAALLPQDISTQSLLTRAEGRRASGGSRTLTSFGWPSSSVNPLPRFCSVKPHPFGMAPVPKPAKLEAMKEQALPSASAAVK